MAPVPPHNAPDVIPRQGSPPPAFLDAIIDALLPLPDDVFEADPYHDIYTVLAPVLGPWTSLLHRKAVMCEALRCIAAFESGWDWNCAADTTAGQETPEETETGAFQFSANSMNLGPGLRQFIIEKLGSDHPAIFIPAMKQHHALACEYAARLLRFSTRWDGPVNRGWVSAAVSRDAVNEFQTFLASAGDPQITV